MFSPDSGPWKHLCIFHTYRYKAQTSNNAHVMKILVKSQPGYGVLLFNIIYMAILYRSPWLLNKPNTKINSQALILHVIIIQQITYRTNICVIHLCSHVLFALANVINNQQKQTKKLSLFWTETWCILFSEF